MKPLTVLREDAFVTTGRAFLLVGPEMPEPVFVNPRFILNLSKLLILIINLSSLYSCD